MLRPPPRSTLFPYTTLFLSSLAQLDELIEATGEAPEVNQIPWAPALHDPGLLAEHRRRSEEHTSELQSRQYLVCRLLLEKKKQEQRQHIMQLRHGNRIQYSH